ncbi:hypothetical protein BB561_000430 [Smittium simulii]|uniref:SEC7 domain-containing protein n=1 Tax=Smittium simulii TaxID=133385 RepID=A0A2T9YZ37_9FUNG|nr:hypothetical protein BB561_000430 [Smittium simulii]
MINNKSNSFVNSQKLASTSFAYSSKRDESLPNIREYSISNQRSRPILGNSSKISLQENLSIINTNHKILPEIKEQQYSANDFSTIQHSELYKYRQNRNKDFYSSSKNLSFSTKSPVSAADSVGNNFNSYLHDSYLSRKKSKPQFYIPEDVGFISETSTSSHRLSRKNSTRKNARIVLSKHVDSHGSISDSFSSSFISKEKKKLRTILADHPFCNSDSDNSNLSLNQSPKFDSKLIKLRPVPAPETKNYSNLPKKVSALTCPNPNDLPDFTYSSKSAGQQAKYGDGYEPQSNSPLSALSESESQSSYSSFESSEKQSFLLLSKVLENIDIEKVSSPNQQEYLETFDQSSFSTQPASNLADENTLDSDFVEKNLVFSPLGALVAQLTSELFNLIVSSNSNKSSKNQSKVVSAPFDSEKSSLPPKKIYKDKALPRIPEENMIQDSSEYNKNQNFGPLWIDEILSKAKQVSIIDEHIEQSILSKLTVVTDMDSFCRFFNLDYFISNDFDEIEAESSKLFDNAYNRYNKLTLNTSKTFSNSQRHGINSDPIESEDILELQAKILGNVRRSRTWNQNSGEFVDRFDSNEQFSQKYNSSQFGLDFHHQSYGITTGYRSRDPAAHNKAFNNAETTFKNKHKLNDGFDSPGINYISPARVGLLRALGRRQSIRLEPNLGKIILAETRIKTGKYLEINQLDDIHNLVKDDLSIALHLKNTPNLSKLSAVPKTDEISYDRYLLDSVHTVDLIKLPPVKIFTTTKPKSIIELAQLTKVCGGTLYSTIDNSLCYSFSQDFYISEEKMSSLIGSNSEFYYFDYNLSFIKNKLRNNSDIIININSKPNKDEAKKQILDYYEKNFKTVELPPPVPLRVKRSSAIPKTTHIILACEKLSRNNSAIYESDNSIYISNINDSNYSLQKSSIVEIKNSLAGVKAIIDNRLTGYSKFLRQSQNYYTDLPNPKKLILNKSNTSKSFYDNDHEQQPYIYKDPSVSTLNDEGFGRVPTSAPPKPKNSSKPLPPLIFQNNSTSSANIKPTISASTNKRLSFATKPNSHLTNIGNKSIFYEKNLNSTIEITNTKKNFNNLTIDALSAKNSISEGIKTDYLTCKTFDNPVSSKSLYSNQNYNGIKTAEENSTLGENRIKPLPKAQIDSKNSMTPLQYNLANNEILKNPSYSQIKNCNRNLLLHGPVYKVMSALSAQTDAYIFLFSDVLVVTRSFFNQNNTNNSLTQTKSLLPFNPSSNFEEVPLNTIFNPIMVIPLINKATSLSTTRNITPSVGLGAKQIHNSNLLQLEYDLRRIRRKFNNNPSGAIISLVDSKIITPQPSKLADFLIRTTQLNRQQLGKFICSGLLARELGEDATQDEIIRENKYYSSVWKIYLDRYNLGGVPLDEALRQVLLNIKLPNDSMAINMLLEQFALNWFNKNRPLADAYQNLAKTHVNQLISSYAETNNNQDGDQKISHLQNTRFKKFNFEIDNDKNGIRGLPGTTKKRLSLAEIANTDLSNNFINFIWVAPSFELSKRLVYAIMTLNAELHNPLVCNEISPEVAFYELVKKFFLQLPANTPASENLIPFSTDFVYKSQSSMNSSTIPPAFLAQLDPNSKKESFLKKKDQNALSPFLEIPLQELYAIWERTKAYKLQQASTTRNVDPTLEWDWVDYCRMFPEENQELCDQKDIESKFNTSFQLKSPYNVDIRKAKLLLTCPCIPSKDLNQRFSFLNDIYSDPGFKDGLLFNTSTDRIPSKINVASPALMRITISIPEPDPNYYIAIRIVGSSTSLQHLTSESGYSEFSKGYIGDINKSGFSTRVRNDVLTSDTSDQFKNDLSNYEALALRSSLDLLTNDNFNPNAPISVLPSDILSFATSNKSQFFIVPKTVGQVTIQFLAYGSRARYYSPLPARTLTIEGGFMLHTLQLTWSKPGEQPPLAPNVSNPGTTTAISSPYGMPLGIRTGYNASNPAREVSKNTPTEHREPDMNLDNSMNAQPTQVRYMFGTTSQQSKTHWAEAIKSILKVNASSFKSNSLVNIATGSPRSLEAKNHLDINSANDLSDEIYKSILNAQKNSAYSTNSTPQTSKQICLTGTDLVQTVLFSGKI